MRDRRRYPRVQFLRRNAATRDEQELLAAKLMGLQHDKDPIAGDHDGTCSMTIQHKADQEDAARRAPVHDRQGRGLRLATRAAGTSLARQHLTGAQRRES
jgi:hypothetical protein